MKTEIGVVLDVNCPAITAFGTILFMGAGTDPAAFQRAAIFMCLFDRIVSPGAHVMSRPAQRMPFFIESNVIRCIF